MRKIFLVLIKIIRSVLTCSAWVGSILYLGMALYEDYYIKSYSFLAFIGLIITVVIITWQKYNYHKFGKMDRRKFPQPVTAENVGEIFAVTGKTVEEFRLSNSLSLKSIREYDSAGNRFVDRLIMLADTTESEVCPPFTASTTTIILPHECKPGDTEDVSVCYQLWENIGIS